MDSEVEIDLSSIDGISEEENKTIITVLEFPMKKYIVKESLSDIRDIIQSFEPYAWQYNSNDKMPDWIKELIKTGKLLRDEEGLSTTGCLLILPNEFILWDGEDVVVLDEIVFYKIFQ